MKVTDNRSFTVQLEAGETKEKLLTALAIANVALAAPIEDEGDIHKDFVASDTICADDVAQYVRADGVSMLFVKGRMCFMHIKAEDAGSDQVTLTVVTYDDDLNRLFGLADEVLARLAASDVTIEELPAEHLVDDFDDETTQVDISLDLNEIFAGDDLRAKKVSVAA